MKSEIANKLIKRVEAIIPRLGDYIESVLVATPLTMERYTGNSKGAAYGWSRNVHFYGSKHMNIQTPIKNLYLSSNWTKIGGGVEGVMRSAQRTYDLISNNTRLE
jgi:phytoene dehydrogenase-like protein